MKLKHMKLIQDKTINVKEMNSPKKKKKGKHKLVYNVITSVE